MTIIIAFQLTLVWALAVATLAVYRGAREVSAAARLRAATGPDTPTLRRGGDPGLRRGLAALGLAVTPTAQRTRLVLKLTGDGHHGPEEWHDFLAQRGALALGALGVAPAAAIARPSLAVPILLVGGWIVWRGQEARYADGVTGSST